jgi:ATP-dependent RNA helicase UAP56/SUB2
MSVRPDEEELVDYDEAAEETFAPPAATDAKADDDKKGSYVGIHSTGFRQVIPSSNWKGG